LALHATALLAKYRGTRFANHEIATALRVSEHHLAKVMQQLAKARVIDSTRGPRGGFQLHRDAENTTLLDIYVAVEGPMNVPGCLLAERICDGTDCMIGRIVHSVHEQVRLHLAKTTLAELAEHFTLVSLDADRCGR
jgi:Rrf2 family protein